MRINLGIRNGVLWRRTRVAAVLAVIAAAVAVPVALLPPGDGPRSEICQTIRRSPTTQGVNRSAGRFGFDPPAPGRPVISPPNGWYAYAGGGDGRLGHSAFAGDVWSGLMRWASKAGAKLGPLGSPARGDGLIFVPTPAGTIQGMDEMSREVTLTITPPQPVQRVEWVDGRLIAAGERSVYAFDGAGKLEWTADAGGDEAVLVDMTIGGTTVGVAVRPRGDAAAAGRALLGFDRRTGAFLWRTELPDMALVKPACDGKAFYCIALEERPRLTAIAAKGGAILWKSPVEPTPSLWASLEPPVVAPAAGGGVVCVAWDRFLYGIDAATGRNRWTWETSDVNADAKRPGWLGPPVIHDGVAFLSGLRELHGIDCRDGRELWRGGVRSRDTVARTWPPIVAGDVLAYPLQNGYFACVQVAVPSRAAAALPVAVALPGWALTVGGAAIAAIGIVAAFLRRIKMLAAVVSAALCAVTCWAWAGSYASRAFVGAEFFAATQYKSAADSRPSPTKVSSESTTGVDSANGALTVGKRKVVWESTVQRAVQGDPSSAVWCTRAPLREIGSNGACVEDPPADLGLTRFAWTHRARPSGTPLGEQAETALTIPHWAAAAVFGAIPIVWLAGWRDRRRYPKGHCAGCGYDLRGGQVVCPECGRRTAATGANEAATPAGDRS